MVQTVLALNSERCPALSSLVLELKECANTPGYSPFPNDTSFQNRYYYLSWWTPFSTFFLLWVHLVKIFSLVFLSWCLFSEPWVDVAFSVGCPAFQHHLLNKLLYISLLNSLGCFVSQSMMYLKSCLKFSIRPDMLAHTCNSSTWQLNYDCREFEQTQVEMCV